MQITDSLFDWNAVSTPVDSSKAANGSGELFDKFIGGLSGLANTAANVANAFKSNKDNTPKTNYTTGNNALMQYLPLILGGVAVLFVGVLLLRRK